MRTTYHPAEYEDRNPGKGAIAPRAWNPRSNNDSLSLNGDWKFRYSPTVPQSEDFAKVDGVTDKTWDTLPVPSTWVLHGYGAPAYQNIRFPFPVDPPRVPTENPTGDFRVSFDLPQGWKLSEGSVSVAGIPGRTPKLRASRSHSSGSMV